MPFSGIARSRKNGAHNLIKRDTMHTNEQSNSIRMMVESSAMENAGILVGDIIIVEKVFTELNNRIVVVMLNGEMLLRRYEKQGCTICLVPATKKLAPIEIDTRSCDFSIVGVVKYVMKVVSYER